MGSRRLAYLGIHPSDSSEMAMVSDQFVGKARFLGGGLSINIPGVGRVRMIPSTDDIKNVLRVPERLHKKVKAEAGRLVKKVEETRKRVTKEAGRAVKKVAGAAEAVARLADRELRAAQENIADTAEALAEGENPLEVAWKSVTSPIKTSNDNLLRAVQESPLLAMAASIAASVYGGPAGSAAFSAWMAFNASGGDLSVALRIGVTQGLTSYVTSVVAKLPVGQREAAAAALSAAKVQLEGANSEETRAAAIASLMDAISGHVSAADLNLVQRALVTGAANGLAVAANNGKAEDIRDAFLKSSGQIVVQYGKSELAEVKAGAEAQIAAKASALFDEEDLAKISQLLDEIAARRDEIDAAIQKTKAGLAGQVAGAQNAAAAVLEQVRTLQASIDEGIGELETIASETRQELTSIKTKADADIAALNPGNINVVDLAAGVQAKVADIKKTAEAAAAEIGSAAAKLAGEADARIDAREAELRGLRATVLEQTLTEGGVAGVRAITGDLLLSWDFNQLNPAGKGKAVVLTFAGEGGVIDHQLKGLIDTEAAPEKILEKVR